MTLTLTRITRNSTYADIEALNAVRRNMHWLVDVMEQNVWGCDLRAIAPHAAWLEQARADLAALEEACREAGEQP